MSHKDHIGVGYYGFSNNSDRCPWCEIERLRAVIKKHQTDILASEGPCLADLELWNSVSEEELK